MHNLIYFNHLELKIYSTLSCKILILVIDKDLLFSFNLVFLHSVCVYCHFHKRTWHGRVLRQVCSYNLDPVGHVKPSAAHKRVLNYWFTKPEKAPHVFEVDLIGDLYCAVLFTSFFISSTKHKVNVFMSLLVFTYSLLWIFFFFRNVYSYSYTSVLLNLLLLKIDLNYIKSETWHRHLRGQRLTLNCCNPLFGWFKRRDSSGSACTCQYQMMRISCLSNVQQLFELDLTFHFFLSAGCSPSSLTWQNTYCPNRLCSCVWSLWVNASLSELPLRLMWRWVQRADQNHQCESIEFVRHIQRMTILLIPTSLYFLSVIS